jgi:Protein of unknown function (DUF3489)
MIEEASAGQGKTKVGSPRKSRPGSKQARLLPNADLGSKQSRVIAMLQSPAGATIAAIMEATGWQQHSIRGFLAGVVRKRLKLKLGSNKVDGVRVYRIAGVASSKRRPRKSERQSSSMPRVRVAPALPDRKTIDVEVARLRDLDVGELRSRWHNVFARRPHAHMPLCLERHDLPQPVEGRSCDHRPVIVDVLWRKHAHSAMADCLTRGGIRRGRVSIAGQGQSNDDQCSKKSDRYRNEGITAGTRAPRV